MAVGTVSGVNPDDTWQLIATNTLSSSASSTFSSLSGYKTYILVFKSIVTSVNAQYLLRFNGDSTNGNYFGGAYYPGANASSHSAIPLTAETSTALQSGMCFIYNADKSIPHQVEVTSAYTQANKNGYIDPNPITSMTIIPSTGNFTSGTFYLYGIAA